VFRYIPKVRFEWDGRKAKSNELKHGVTFEDAITCCGSRYLMPLRSGWMMGPSRA